MQLVHAFVTAAKVTTAAYRIAATAVMGYYLVKGVTEYEMQRRKESKNAAINAYRNAVGEVTSSPNPGRARRSPAQRQR